MRGCSRVQGCERCEDGGEVGARVYECESVGCMCKNIGVGVESLCGNNLANLMAARAVEHNHLLPEVSKVRRALLARVEDGH